MSAFKPASESGSTSAGTLAMDHDLPPLAGRLGGSRSLEPRDSRLPPHPRYRFGDILTFGESRRCEFKLYKNYLGPDHFAVLAKTICAFANADGGLLLLGVNDDRQVCGLRMRPTDLHAFHAKLIALLNTAFTVQIQPFVEIDYRPVAGRTDVFVVELAVSKVHLPFGLLTAQGDCFYRRLASSQRLFGEEILSLCEQETRSSVAFLLKRIRELPQLDKAEARRLLALCEAICQD